MMTSVWLWIDVTEGCLTVSETLRLVVYGYTILKCQINIGSNQKIPPPLASTCKRTSLQSFFVQKVILTNLNL